MSSLLLDNVSWDLTADASNNIAVADEPYSTIQDVANAVRTVLGEVWFDTTLGIDYFGLILGKAPSLALLKNAIVQAAKSVLNVSSAKCVIQSFANRVLSGQVQVVTSVGTFIIPFSKAVVP
jgi:hypothetical protein